MLLSAAMFQWSQLFVVAQAHPPCQAKLLPRAMACKHCGWWLGAISFSVIASHSGRQAVLNSRVIVGVLVVETCYLDTSRLVTGQLAPSMAAVVAVT